MKEQKTVKKDKKTLFIIIGTIISIISFSFLFKDIIYPLELSFYNFMSQESADSGVLAAPNKADKNIMLVAIDDYSCQKIKKYPELKIGKIPWQRKVIADLLNFVEEGKPKAVILDFIFSGEEGFEKGNTESDRLFANSLKGKNNVILTNILYNNKEEGISNKQLPQRFKLNIKNSDFDKNKKTLNSIKYNSYEELYPLFLKETHHLGIANTVYDPKDTVIRVHRPIYEVSTGENSAFVPSSALEAVLSITKDKKITFKDGGYVFGNRIIKVDNEGNFFINWHGKANTYKNIPAIKPLLTKAYEKGIIKRIDSQDLMDPSIFKDKIVVIGMTRSLTDIHATPLDTRHFGPEIVATTIDNILNDTDISKQNSRHFVQKVPLYINIFVALFFGFIAGYFSYRTKYNHFSFIWLVGMIIAFIYFAFYLFAVQRYWIYIAPPLFAMIFSTLTVYLYKINNANKAKKQVENLFGKFVSPEVAKKLIDNPDSISRRGEKKELSILFTDIRDFTTIAEQTAPRELILQLNEFFDVMTQVIFKHGGTVDKYIGDSIMAFFGDPLEMEDHAQKSVLAAKEIIIELEKLNKKWLIEGQRIFKIGIGINTGEVIVGHIGASNFLSYTVIGDDVNLASRLEGLNKQYGTSIIIGHKTYEAVKNTIQTQELAITKVKGKYLPVQIYSVEV